MRASSSATRAPPAPFSRARNRTVSAWGSCCAWKCACPSSANSALLGGPRAARAVLPGAQQNRLGLGQLLRLEVRMSQFGQQRAILRTGFRQDRQKLRHRSVVVELFVKIGCQAQSLRLRWIDAQGLLQFCTNLAGLPLREFGFAQEPADGLHALA